MKEVVQQVRLWAAIAARKDFAAYEGFYAPDLHAGWRHQPRRVGECPEGALRAERPACRSIVQNLKVRPNGLDRATAEFVQDYDDNMRPVATRKTLEFTKVGDKWLINRESSAPADKK